MLHNVLLYHSLQEEGVKSFFLPSREILTLTYPSKKIYILISVMLNCVFTLSRVLYPFNYFICLEFMRHFQSEYFPIFRSSVCYSMDLLPLSTYSTHESKLGGILIVG